MPLTKIDDRDPPVELSTTSWTILNDPAQPDGTVIHSPIPGSSLTIAFASAPISTLGGIQFKAIPTSTYTIDNDAPTLFSLDAQNPKTQHGQDFSKSDKLPSENHIPLVVNKANWVSYNYFVARTPDHTPTNVPPTNSLPTSPPPASLDSIISSVQITFLVTTTTVGTTTSAQTNPTSMDLPPMNSPTTNPPSPPSTNPPTTNPPSTNPPSTNPPSTNPPSTNPSTNSLPINPPPTSTQSLQVIPLNRSTVGAVSSVLTTPPQSTITTTADTPTSARNTSVRPQSPSLSSVVASPTDAHATMAQNSHLSVAAVAGIVFGVGIAAVIIFVLLYYLYHKRKGKNITFNINDFRRGNVLASRSKAPPAPDTNDLRRGNFFASRLRS